MDKQDYKNIIIEYVKRISDKRLLESLYYIIQKMCKGF
mgnify:CR=1 FL=1